MPKLRRFRGSIGLQCSRLARARGDNQVIQDTECCICQAAPITSDHGKLYKIGRAYPCLHASFHWDCLHTSVLTSQAWDVPAHRCPQCMVDMHSIERVGRDRRGILTKARDGLRLHIAALQPQPPATAESPPAINAITLPGSTPPFSQALSPQPSECQAQPCPSCNNGFRVATCEATRPDAACHAWQCSDTAACDGGEECTCTIEEEVSLESLSSSPRASPPRSPPLSPPPSAVP